MHKNYSMLVSISSEVLTLCSMLVSICCHMSFCALNVNMWHPIFQSHITFIYMTVFITSNRNFELFPHPTMQLAINLVCSKIMRTSPALVYSTTQSSSKPHTLCTELQSASSCKDSCKCTL